jgi:hypothetical protein
MQGDTFSVPLIRKYPPESYWHSVSLSSCSQHNFDFTMTGNLPMVTRLVSGGNITFFWIYGSFPVFNFSLGPSE